MEKSLYEVLEVSNNASRETIEAAYRALLHKGNGRAQTGEDAENRVKFIAAAYGVLSDPNQRLLYDQRLTSAAHPHPPSTPIAQAADGTQPDGGQPASPHMLGAQKPHWAWPEWDVTLPISSQALALIGSLMLVIGVFLPLVKMPILGSVNYFFNGRGDGVLVLITAVVSLYLAITKRLRPLWWTGLICAVLLGFSFYKFKWGFSQLESTVKAIKDMDINLAAGVATLMGQMEWGWAVLALGAAMVMLAGAIKENS